MMPLHDTATVAGVTEACRYNDHSMCNNPACGCDCHTKAAQAKSNNGHIPVDNGPEKSCPKCGVKRPAYEIFCRIDGERLSSLSCAICGKGREPEDKFCFNCGSPANAVKGTGDPFPEHPVINIPTVPSVEEPAVDYAKSILAGIQEELGNVSQPEEGLENVNQQVVEQPAGSQGSFKLVSRPNANKVRVPAGGKVNQQAVQSPGGSPSQRFKLPIKPA